MIPTDLGADVTIEGQLPSTRIFSVFEKNRGSCVNGTGDVNLQLNSVTADDTFGIFEFKIFLSNLLYKKYYQKSSGSCRNIHF